MRTGKSGWMIFMDLLIYGILAGNVLYALFQPMHNLLQMSTVAVSAVIASILIWTGGRFRQEPGDEGATVTKIILLDEDGEHTKEWFIKGQVSILIGKNSSRGEVDIDLSDSEYASLVSPEHAILNRVGNNWFIEDAHSHSGTGIRKAGRSDANRLVVEEPVRVEPGDMIFIANTRLLLK